MPSTPRAATPAEPTWTAEKRYHCEKCAVTRENGRVAILEGTAEFCDLSISNPKTAARAALIASAPAMAAELVVLRARVEALEKALRDLINSGDLGYHGSDQTRENCPACAAVNAAAALLTPKVED